MLFALLLVAQVAAGPVATCSAPVIPNNGRGSSSGATPRGGSSFDRARSTSRRSCCAIPNAAPVIGENEIRVSHKSANGGRTIEWRITNGTVDARSLCESRSRSERRSRSRSRGRSDEHRRGRSRWLAQCREREREPFDSATVARNGGLAQDRPGAGRAEWTISAGVAHSVNLFQSTAGRSYAVQTIGWGRELTRELGTGVAARAICVGRRGDADLRAVLARVDLRNRVCAAWCGDGTSRRSRDGRRLARWRWEACGLPNRSPRKPAAETSRRIGAPASGCGRAARTQWWSRIAFSISRTATSSARIPASTATSC